MLLLAPVPCPVLASQAQPPPYIPQAPPSSQKHPLLKPDPPKGHWMHVMEFGVAAVCVKKLPLQPQNPIPLHGHHPNQIEGFVLDSFQPVAEDVGGCRHQLHSPFSPTKSLGGDHHQ